MRSNTDLMDPRDAQEAMRAFATPATGQELATVDGFRPLSGNSISITDGIITAQKVDVERDERKVLQKITTLAAVAGDDWFYRFPVKKKGGGQDFIEGPSIKCANNVARSYGNCQVDSRVVDTGATWIIYARFVDYETGFSLTRPFQQDKAGSQMGGSDAARKRDIALQIGVSKAIRNVICNALETFTTFAFEEAQKNLVGKIGKQLPHYKTRVADRLKELGVTQKRVELNLGRTFEHWLAPDVARVIAEIKAVTDGMATAEETWPPEAPPEPKRGDFVKAKDAAADTVDETQKPAAEPEKATTTEAAKVEGETGAAAVEQPQFETYRTFSAFNDFSEPFLKSATPEQAKAWDEFYRAKIAEYAQSRDKKIKEAAEYLVELFVKATAPGEAE